jgi:aspartate racemase
VATVGLVGGLGPESTIDYYRRILDAWARERPGSAPSIVIDSLDVQRALRLVAGDRPALVEYLLASIHRLARAGVDFAALTANTPHLVFDELVARSPVPLVSIVEACAEAARERGLRRVALLGTRFTMEAPFYPAVCARYGVAVVAPAESDRAWVHERYVGELLRGEFREETRREITTLVERLRDAEDVDGVVLGGTELPLLLPGPAIAGLPVLDTTALHVAAIVKRLSREEGEAITVL